MNANLYLSFVWPGKSRLEYCLDNALKSFSPRPLPPRAGSNVGRAAVVIFVYFRGRENERESSFCFVADDLQRTAKYNKMSYDFHSYDLCAYRWMRLMCQICYMKRISRLTQLIYSFTVVYTTKQKSANFRRRISSFEKLFDLNLVRVRLFLTTFADFFSNEN